MDQKIKPAGTLESTAICVGVAALVGAGTFAMLLLVGDWTFLQGIFGAFVVAAALLVILLVTVGRPLAPPVSSDGAQTATADLARAEAPGTPGEAGRPLTPRPLDVPSPHRDEIAPSLISTTSHETMNDPRINRAISPGPGGTPMAEAAPATRIPAPAPVNADAEGVARPVGATTDPEPQAQPAPLDGAVVAPEAPAGHPQTADRNDAAPSAAESPAPTATARAQSYNETDPVETKAAAAASGTVSEGDEEEGVKPTTLDAPRGGTADDLKRIKGVGPKLEQLCNRLGFYHFDQIASWSEAEVAWVDANLEGFKGRVKRDDWVEQAKQLSEGGETAFSKKVDKGGVY